MLSEEKRRDIQDAIKAGITVTEIRTLLSTSAGTISNVKREMGIPLRRMRKPRRAAPETVPQARLRKEEQEAGYLKAVQTAQATIMHHRDIPRHAYLERVKELQPAPAQAYTPQEYFEAIADGLRQRDMENNTLKLERQQLREENRRLLSDLNQCKHQMANWSGPVALPSMSLGNGG